jgi:hypothetical protein
MAWCDTLLTRIILVYFGVLFAIVNSTTWCAADDDLLFWVVEFLLAAVTVNAVWFFVRVFTIVRFPLDRRDAFEKYIVGANNKEP